MWCIWYGVDNVIELCKLLVVSHCWESIPMFVYNCLTSPTVLRVYAHKWMRVVISTTKHVLLNAHILANVFRLLTQVCACQLLSVLTYCIWISCNFLGTVYTAQVRTYICITWKCYALSCIVSEQSHSLLLPHMMSCVHTNTVLLVEPYVICELLQCPLYATLVETTIATTPNCVR